MYSNINSIYSSEDFQLFFRNSPQSLVIKSDTPKFTIIAASNEYLQLVHKNSQEVVGKGFFEVFPGSESDPTQSQSLFKAFCELLKTKETQSQPLIEYDVHNANTGFSETQYWNIVNQPVLDQAGGIVSYIVNTTTNITEKILLERAINDSKNREQVLTEKLRLKNQELTGLNNERQMTINALTQVNRKFFLLNEELIRANETLSESEKRFRNMAENSGILIAVGDANGAITYVNNAWSKFTGRPIKDLLTFGWTKIIHPEDIFAFMEVHIKSVGKQQPYTAEYRILASSGDYRWLYCYASPRLNSDGLFAGFISSYIDVTERKNDDLRKNEFISMVSHELKTPLTSTIGYLQVLHKKLTAIGDPTSITILDRSIKQIGKMTKMINGFLNVSRLESGKIYIDKDPFDLAQLLIEIAEEQNEVVLNHTLVFAPVEKTLVEADYEKIGHVINNFITNAVKYSPIGSTIYIGCSTVDGEAIVSVKDEGIGISEEELPHVFEKYFRAKDPSIQNIAGFGIGLYICSEIIQRHNGAIWATSEPERGSTFTFSLRVFNR